ncbi:MAG TPA: alpha/beta hydrolase [Phenylobacterium sp.]|uniref:alpha/beta fold hydrolase n=1 Tax=Phenylobacterium sp. TaxID=1871053 RepID=UPI002C7CADE1|nr:alpha/beta hydrolase [Phenylobacterium sp.]HSV04692.1 alpha/beta hydrolase [Phenylobacterium sp.]
MAEQAGYLTRDDGARLAWRKIDGRGAAVVWLGGFRSDMTGTKAQALAEWAQAAGRSYVRFDYFGHGASDGDFQQGTITRWRADALAVLEALVEGEAVLVGSSMGGWLACLAALAAPERIKAMVLVAPAPDFTEALMKPGLPPQGRAALEREGVWLRPSLYGEPYPITRTLLEDGARWSILPGPVPIEVPVRILQGGEDPDVPWTHALELAQAIKGEDVVFTLVKDGDHRLSRPQDIARLIAAVGEVA